MDDEEIGKVEERYKNFISSDVRTFVKMNVEDYLARNYRLAAADETTKKMCFDKLETAHRDFFK